jgi:hypothetical protein
VTSSRHPPADSVTRGAGRLLAREAPRRLAEVNAHRVTSSVRR